MFGLVMASCIVTALLSHYLTRRQVIGEFEGIIRKQMTEYRDKMTEIAHERLNEYMQYKIATTDQLSLCVNHPDYKPLANITREIDDLELEIQDAIREIEADGLTHVFGKVRKEEDKMLRRFPWMR